jgi:hypothetical protein
MQHLENDMEELFKRAGENYSPQKGKGDWESIAKRIADKSTSPTAIEPAGNSRNRKIITLFLSLFILSALLFIIINTTSTSTSSSKQNKGQKISNNTPHKLKIKNNNRNFQKADVSNDFASRKKSGNKDRMKITGSSNRALSKLTAVIAPVAHYSTNNRQDLNWKKWENGLIKDNIYKRENDFPGQLDRGVKSANPVSENVKLVEIISEEGKSESKISKEDSISSAKKNEAVIRVRKESGFYIGLVAATDFSKVKSALYHSTGFDGGLIAGYRVNKKLSLETGVIWNKKSYNSEGQYFSMAKVGSAMPAGMIINDIESHSSLIEIPLKVKYDFIRKRSSAFYIGAGVSAYIMTKEKNMYHVTMNGNQEKMSGVYETNSYGIPAVAGVSVGYERKVSGKMDIRLEPFVKVPLRGIGVGSLPVTSAGFQVGVARRLQ